MNKKYVSAGALALLALMFASIGIAAAQVGNEYYPNPINYALKSKMWYFSTDCGDLSGNAIPGDGIADFNGNNVVKSSVIAVYWIDGDPTEHIVKPALVLTTKNQVILLFWPCSIPSSIGGPEGSGGTRVEGQLKDGATIYATGPGYAFGGIR